MNREIKDLGIHISDGNYSSKYPRSEEFVKEGVPFIRANNLVNGEVTDEDMYFITPEKHAILLKGHLQEGDVLITTRGNIGQVGIVPKRHIDSNINAQLVLLRTNPKELYNRYLLWALQSQSVKKQYQTLQTGTALKQLPVGKLEQVSIKVTDIISQHNIADNLDKIYKIINDRKKELNLLDDLIKARFVEMFGDMVINPNNWDKHSLGELCDVRDGTHDSPQYYGDGYPLVTSKNVTDGKIDITNCNFISEEDYKKINQRSKVDIGDILMPMIGTVGNPVIVDIEPNFAIKNVALIKFKSDSRVLNSFVKILLESDYFDNAVISKIRGGTQKFISLGDIRKLDICLPPLEVQISFEKFIKHVDKSKFSVMKGNASFM